MYRITRYTSNSSLQGGNQVVLSLKRVCVCFSLLVPVTELAVVVLWLEILVDRYTVMGPTFVRDLEIIS